MPLTLTQQDITKMKVDAIVNAANTELKMGGGVCGAIFRAAGVKTQAACDRLAPIETGQAVVTPGFALPAQYVIHAAGPVYHNYTPQESEALSRGVYKHSECRRGKGCQSVAFPLISSGIYGYPKGEALKVAVSAIRDFLKEQEMEVYLTLFDKEVIALARNLFGELEHQDA